MTDIDLKEHLEGQIHEVEKRLCLKIDNIDRAIELAREVMDHRLEGMNAFRLQMEQQTREFVTREANDLLHTAQEREFKSTERRLQEVEKAKSNLDGRIVAAGFVVLVVLQFVLAYLT